MTDAPVDVKMIGFFCPAQYRDHANYVRALGGLPSNYANFSDARIAIGGNPQEPNGVSIAIASREFGIITAVLSPALADEFALALANQLTTRESLQ